MKKFIEKLKSIKKSTLLRTVLQLLVYVNQLLILINQSPMGNNPIYIWISFGVTILVTALNYWYNNDWTNLAQIAGSLFEMLKDGKITKEEVEEFLKNHNKPKDGKE